MDLKYNTQGTPEIRVIEECGELIQALCKANRFGWFNWDPRTPECKNIDNVLSEVDDVKSALLDLELKIEQVKLQSQRPMLGGGLHLEPPR